MKTLKQKAEEMLARAQTVVLASVSDDGFPRPVPMSRIASEGFATVWMATGADSVKTAHFRQNPLAGLCYSENGDSVVLTGRIEVVTDPAAKTAYWQEWFIDHFDGGSSDPNYVLLRFSGESVTFWIDGQFVRRRIRENEY